MFRVSDLEGMLGVKPATPLREGEVSNVSIDSRTLQAGAVFVAISRERDGHDFVDEARRKGASAFVLCESAWRSRRFDLGENVFLVRDTTQALGAMARAWRKRHRVRAIAVTGSSGKSSTKEMANLLLSRCYRVLATEGNLNNQWGLPLTIFRLREEHQVLLVERGASRPGDIAYLASILEPELGAITNVYPAHLEGLGSLEGVYAAKLELAGELSRSDGTLAISGDDALLAQKARELAVRVVTFGRHESHYRMTRSWMENGGFGFEVNGRWRFRLECEALFQTDNFLAAIALAHEAGVPMEDLEGPLRSLVPLPGRFEIHQLADGVTAVYDGYNANPGSMLRGLEGFARRAEANGARAQRRIAVLADMKELGPETREWHRAVGRELRAFALDLLVTVGRDSREISEEARSRGAAGEIHHFASNTEVAGFLRNVLAPGDWIFLKGARAMKMEEILSALKEIEAEAKPS